MTELKPSRLPGLGVRLAGLGAVSQVIGLGIDAWLHARDPGLAARESAFSLDNVGHVLLLLGVALVVAGVAGMIVGRSQGAAGVSRRRRAGEAGALMAIVVLLSGSAAAAGSRMSSGHDHAETVAGSHEIGFAEIDGRFDVNRPEMLLYDGNEPTSRIVGLTYYVLASVPPPGFVGAADRWHKHMNTCITPDGPVFAGDGYRRCRGTGRNAWMLHAWVVPGYESPQGIFSAENARLS